MTDLPPPPVLGEPTARHEAPPGTRPGDLTFTWRLVLALGWIAAFFAYAAVWQASVQLGLATWWVGPRSQPAPVLIRMLPFIMTIAVSVLVVYSVRRLSQISGAVAALSIVISLPDFSRSVGLAVVEVLISLSLIMVSVASMTGRYRAAPDEPAAPASPVDATATSSFLPPPSPVDGP